VVLAEAIVAKAVEEEKREESGRQEAKVGSERN
jgi:hypothetical protein